MSLHDQIERWSKVADRPLTKFEQMVIARPFKYSSYWRTWNRVLKPVYAGLPHGYVEFSLTPVDGWHATEVRNTELRQSNANSNLVRGLELAAIKIRQHSTAPDPKDKYASAVPDDVRQQLIERIGAEEAQYLLYGNIFDAVDWALYPKIKTLGGGIPLAQCRKSELQGEQKV